ncbi:Trans-12-dihydrobenzene-12-diol dehydrogenase [Dissostichus eleginoides]|uniref:Trans-1,2-dihydrobenzene-1,2-diol dehydrogenase n=1 Tax=Dissostichus eleginoides TaxID=100907 RepID=A0AAD9F7Q7_DISEL|nr:Trans-12-dihydrobenzene-12-diol dehydrogenase [Dissostichus eleginoides]
MATRWGICSTGRISHDFTVALKTPPHEDHQVVAVAARKLEDAQEFATKHSISRVFLSYELMARDPDIDVVYIGVYHPYLLMLFTNAKKNVLCEKPLAMNTKEVKEILSSAKRNDVFLMEISVGVMRMKDGFLRPVRGTLLPLDVEPQWSCQELLAAAIKKQKAFNQVLEDGAHVLLYPDATEITNIPGTDIPFTVQMYKKASGGKPYQQIKLYICTVEDFENSCKCF